MRLRPAAVRLDIDARGKSSGGADDPSAAPVGELYIYYRVPASAHAASLAEVRRQHAVLSDVHAGLQMRCLVRDDQDDDAPAEALTYMEIYRHPGGVDVALQAAIDALMSAWPTQRIGPRHVERFVAV